MQGKVLTLVYDEYLHPSRTPAPEPSRFTVSVDDIHSDGTVTNIHTIVSKVEVAGRTVVLTLGRTVTDGQRVNLDLPELRSGRSDDPIQDIAGNVAAGFEALKVTPASTRRLARR